MPKDNIIRGIKKGTGELEGEVYDEILYEGYGPGGVAVLVECMTDNRNRTVADIRHYFAKSNGNLGESGCVAYMFDKKGMIYVDKSTTTEEELMDMAIEAGGEDVEEDGDQFAVVTAPEDFDAVRESLETAEVVIAEASLTMVPQTVIDVTEEKQAKALIRLLQTLEENEDVQNVHANCDIDDALMEELG
jgi:YebC/PmpR family DNA-binding regulatory protein